MIADVIEARYRTRYDADCDRLPFVLVVEIKAHGPRARFDPWPDLYESGWRRMLFGARGIR